MKLKDKIEKIKIKVEEKRQKRIKKQVNKLADLKKQRLKAEGENKIYKLVEKEKGRIKEAKKQNFARSPLGKLSKEIKSNIKKSNVKGNKKSVFNTKIDSSVYEIGKK